MAAKSLKNSILKLVVSVFFLNISSQVFASDVMSSVSAGSGHTCALATTGKMKCWGYNHYGELGDHTVIDKLFPVNVLDNSGTGLLSGVSVFAAGPNHNCAVMTSGGVKCWGYDVYGQLGDGNSNIYIEGQPLLIYIRSLPADVRDTSLNLLSGVSAIAAGYDHSCALMISGGVKCWGANYSGQLGNNSQNLYANVTASDVVATGGIGLLFGASAIAAGGTHTCALMTNGGVKCWGSGSLGYNLCHVVDGLTICTAPGGSALTPGDVELMGSPELLSGVSAIAAGSNHTCALMTNGGVKCWGNNDYGQLGNPAAENGGAAADVVGLSSGVIAIAVGGDSTCALTIAGTVKCWGRNDDGQLGDNTTVNKPLPIDVVGLGDSVTAITVGEKHSCAVLANGGVQCWGYNSYGQLGDNTVIEKHTPVYVSGLTGRHVKNDYNNDGIAGWIWQGVSNGHETESQNWQLTFPLYSTNWGIPNRFFMPTFPDQANWDIVTTGDFNKDGDADIVWRHKTLASWKIWQMQNGTRVAQNSPPDFDLAHAWTVVGAGDTDKDGDDDIILNNTSTGEVMIWEMQNHAVVATHSVGTKAGYVVNRIGDFNKDGDVDLLLRQIGTDVLITWEIETSAFVTERALANTGTGYNPVCAGDFDGDGDDDIMLINSSTMVEKWFVMENYARTQATGSSNVGFVFLGCGDYDGDGDADMLWQRSADDMNRVVLQQNWGVTKQTVYTNPFGGVGPANAGYGFIYRGNNN